MKSSQAVLMLSTLALLMSLHPLPAREPIVPSTGATNASPLTGRSTASVGVLDTFVVAEFGFENGSGIGDPQGWYSVDRTTHPGVYFHIDDFSGLGGGSFGRLVPLHGDQSLWCGVRADSTSDRFCQYSELPGYGNRWNQVFESVPTPVAGDVAISYMIAWDSESNYDYAYLEYVDGNGDWVELVHYTGVGTAIENWVIPDAGVPDTLRLRFRFESDGAYSDQDGEINTDGAVIIDNVLVADTTAILSFNDFEAEATGDLTTLDGFWSAAEGGGYGDFAALFPGTQLLQEDDCYRNSTWMWGFFEGSQYDYSCGGHPEQLAVPYGNAKDQYIDNQIWSPWIDWTHDRDEVPIPDTAWIGYLEYDVYADLPLDELVFHRWFVRAKVDGGCPTEWGGDGFLTHGPDAPVWALGYRGRLLVSVVIPTDATEVQLSIGVVDGCKNFCGVIGSGLCHSHAPLIDNVRLVRLDPAGPVWEEDGFSIAEYHSQVFQDNFPEVADYTRPGTGEFTAAGKVRVDIGPDIADAFASYILPGDSLVINVTDYRYGLDRDAGGGPAAYLHVRDLPGKSGAVLSGGPRWPYSPSVSGGGWTAVRMDSVPLTTYPEDRFCADLNDNLYEAGDTILYYLSARNTVGVTTYWSEHTGQTLSEAAVRARPMEMTCLPANALNGATDILVVDAHPGSGAYDYFEHDFWQLGITPDRFDMPINVLDANSGLGSRVKDVAQQLIPYYRKIIWTSGDRLEYIIGDGEVPLYKSDDFKLLYDFLDQHTEDCGVYFVGDHLASEVSDFIGSWVTPFRETFLNFTLAAGDHRSLGEPDIPLVVGQPGSCFDKTAGPDTMFAFGACPTYREFDVLLPFQNSAVEMAYSNDPARGAILGADTLNSNAATARVMMSGFGYDAIRDDTANSPYDRVVHLHTILQWLGNTIEAPTGADPSELANGLDQNFPNPFNPTTTIRYSIREKTHVTLRVYNVAGQLVRTLVAGTKNPGVHPVSWDGRNDAGAPVSSGVYFYRLVSGTFTQTRKMVVLK